MAELNAPRHRSLAARPRGVAARRADDGAGARRGRAVRRVGHRPGRLSAHPLGPRRADRAGAARRSRSARSACALSEVPTPVQDRAGAPSPPTPRSASCRSCGRRCRGDAWEGAEPHAAVPARVRAVRLLAPARRERGAAARRLDAGDDRPGGRSSRCTSTRPAQREPARPAAGRAAGLSERLSQRQRRAVADGLLAGAAAGAQRAPAVGSARSTRRRRGAAGRGRAAQPEPRLAVRHAGDARAGVRAAARARAHVRAARAGRRSASPRRHRRCCAWAIICTAERSHARPCTAPSRPPSRRSLQSAASSRLGAAIERRSAHLAEARAGGSARASRAAALATLVAVAGGRAGRGRQPGHARRTRLGQLQGRLRRGRTPAAAWSAGSAATATTSTGSRWTSSLAHPILGIGADNFQQQYLAHGRTQETPHYPHSVELRTLTRRGWSGRCSPLVGLGAALLGGRRGRCAAPIRSRAAVAAAALAGFAYWLVHGSFDWFWEFAGLGAPAFALLGLACALAPRAEASSLAKRRRPPAALAPDGRAAGRRVASGPGVGARGAGCCVALAAALSLAAPWLSQLEVQSAARIWTRAPRRPTPACSDAAQLNPLSDEPTWWRQHRAALRRPGPRRSASSRWRSARTPGDAYATLERGAIASARGDARGRWRCSSAPSRLTRANRSRARRWSRAGRAACQRRGAEPPDPAQSSTTRVNRIVRFVRNRGLLLDTDPHASLAC